MKAENTIINDGQISSIIEDYNEAGEPFMALNDVFILLKEKLQAQAEISFKAGIKEEQKRMTEVLRKLYAKGWTLSDIIEAEDTMG